MSLWPQAFFSFICQIVKCPATARDVSAGSPGRRAMTDAEWRSRSERLSRVGTAALGCPAPLGATEYSPGRKPWVAEETGPSATPQSERHFLLSDQQRMMCNGARLARQARDFSYVHRTYRDPDTVQ